MRLSIKSCKVLLSCNNYRNYNDYRIKEFYINASRRKAFYHHPFLQ